MNDNFPYTQSFKKIPKFFEKIQTAAIPQKFTQKTLEDIFDLKATNDRTLISVLRSLGFIDPVGIPTQLYSDYKNPTNSKKILGAAIKSCYDILYIKNKNVHSLSDDEIKGMFGSITGKDYSDPVLTQKFKTFLQLKYMADFDNVSHVIEELSSLSNDPKPPFPEKPKEYMISHTIVLNLPSTTDQKVYDTLFKSLKENLL